MSDILKRWLVDDVGLPVDSFERVSGGTCAAGRACGVPRAASVCVWVYKRATGHLELGRGMGRPEQGWGDWGDGAEDAGGGR